ncbi:hypothetical protein [Streptomyces sp. NPDC002602]|uniref:hypothetical protein n=1 Tax=Streptomyces sp. NPDC002602 TaxID=3364654 RepID=UPI0036C353FE
MPSREPLRDEELWQACVDAQEQLAHRHSQFFQQVRGKSEVLSAALSAGHWQRAAALAFLADVHDDLAVLPQLVDLAMLPGWASQARRAIANIPREQLVPRLEELLTAHLDQLTDEDDDYYALWVEVLADAEAWALLAQLVRAARASPNLLLQDVAARVADSYGALVTDGGETPATVPSIQDVP